MMHEVMPTAERLATGDTAAGFEERIEHLVRMRTGGLIHGLHVEVDDDRVILTGRTSTFYSKQLATHATLGLLQDQTLNNLIEVD